MTSVIMPPNSHMQWRGCVHGAGLSSVADPVKSSLVIARSTRCGEYVPRAARRHESR